MRHTHLIAILITVFTTGAGLAQEAGQSANDDVETTQVPETTAEPVVVPPTLKTFKEAILPADLGVSTGKHLVTLNLTIDETGAVTDVQVVSSDDERLTEYAVRAASGFELTPATVDGEPVAVQIEYRYAFDIKPKERVVVHKFDVREKGSRSPLDDVTGILEENGRSFTSFGGLMEISNVEPGTYTLYIPAGTFDEVRREFTIAGDKIETGEIYLKRAYNTQNETIIRAPREVRYVAKQTLIAGELKRLPGGGGDVLKLVENLPGIARSAFGTGALVVFGSPPLDTKIYFNSMPFLMLYHFGGMYSVINPEFISKIDFVPAGFDAAFGRAVGGLVDVKLKEDPLDGVHGEVDVNLVHAGLVIGVPYSKDGDIQFAFRRSYFDAILSAIDFGDEIGLLTAPRYYDYQLKLQHRISPKNRFYLFIYGTDDSLEVVNSESQGSRPDFVGTVGLAMYSHAIQAGWHWSEAKNLSNDLKIQVALAHQEFDLFGSLQYDLYDVPINVRNEFSIRASDKVKVNVGLDADINVAWYDLQSPEFQEESDNGAPLETRELIKVSGDYLEVGLAPYVSIEYRPFEWWTLVPSLRADFYTGTWKAWSIDPRLASIWQVVKDTVAIRAAGGMFQQAPQSFYIIPEFGNPEIGPERGVHALVGADYTPLQAPGLTLSGEAFFKYVFDRAETTDDNLERVANIGLARSYGFDVTLRMAPGGQIPLVGWIAYTFTVSEFFDNDTNTWRPSQYDQTHNLNLLLSYELPRNWTIGARFRLTSGYTYTKVTGSVYDSDIDRYVSVYDDQVNGGRLPLFHQLDLRVDKDWVFDNWKLGLYLELQNVYMAANGEAMVYNYDFTQVAYVGSSYLLPIIGIKGSF